MAKLDLRYRNRLTFLHDEFRQQAFNIKFIPGLYNPADSLRGTALDRLLYQTQLCSAITVRMNGKVRDVLLLKDDSNWYFLDSCLILIAIRVNERIV